MKYLSKIIIILLIILIINLNLFRDAYSFLLTPLFNYIYKLDKEEKLYNEFVYYKNNIGSYKDLFVELQMEKAKNNELLETLEFKNNNSNLKGNLGLIISRDIDNWNNSVTINIKTKNNQTVINDDGLVGIVENSSQYSSKVKLLTDSNFGKIAVKVIDEKNTYYGILDKDFKITGISEKVNIDAIVLTSELSTKIKENIKIGTIKEIVTDQYDLEKTLIVKPYVDFSRIKYVYVIEE